MRPTQVMSMMALMLVCVAAGCAGTGTNAAMKMEMLKRQGEAQRNLGEAYLSEGQYTPALRELLKAEGLYAEDPYLQNDLGLAYMGKKEPEQAADRFKRALAIKPEYSPARNNLGSAYLAMEDWDAAIACFEELTSNLLYATPHYPLANLGWAHYNKREYGLAEKYYHRALEIEPGFPLALRGLGITYLDTGRAGAAVTELEKAVQKAPQFTQAHFDLARAYGAAGDTGRAIEACRQIIETSPDSPLARAATQLLDVLQ